MTQNKYGQFIYIQNKIKKISKGSPNYLVGTLFSWKAVFFPPTLLSKSRKVSRSYCIRNIHATFLRKSNLRMTILKKEKHPERWYQVAWLK